MTSRSYSIFSWLSIDGKGKHVAVQHAHGPTSICMKISIYGDGTSINHAVHVRGMVSIDHWHMFAREIPNHTIKFTPLSSMYSCCRLPLYVKHIEPLARE